MFVASACVAAGGGLTLEREGQLLIIRGDPIPGQEIRVNYLEAYCRAGSTDADWISHTVIPHTNEFLLLSAQKKLMRLRDTLADGLIVEHTITAGDDEVDFRLVAHNPTALRSEAHWAQPCVRLGPFTGFTNKLDRANLNDYLPKCFIFLDDQMARMPTHDWATQARYTPGQVWCPRGVPRTDVNPRPLSSLVPSNGLIGGFSSDDKLIFATAWQPYQELFQGVIRCLHSDFRLGVGAGALIFALSCVLSEHHRQFKVPGFGAKVCYLLGRWGDSSGFKEIAKKVFRLGRTLDERRIQRASRLGGLAVVRFETPDFNPSEIAQRAADFGKSNGHQVIRRSVSVHPNTFELVVDSDAKPQMEAFIRELMRAKANSD
jgi:hypothetical protein